MPTTHDVLDVLADLAAEAEILDELLSGLAPAQWTLPTPAPGWTITHQVAHLIADFRMAMLAAREPAAFSALTDRLGGEFDDKVRLAMADFLAGPPETLFGQWRGIRASALQALAEVPSARMLPWLARPLPAAALAAAGFMEVFAHGQDIADALQVRREYTDRIRHVVDFALGNWDFGYQVRGIDPPDRMPGWDLVAPSGAAWTIGDASAAQRISGPAVDFCLLVTRRRHRADLNLVATGPDADRWLDLAQAYRGVPGPGRQPGQFSPSM